jgi:hypothetical protein
MSLPTHTARRQGRSGMGGLCLVASLCCVGFLCVASLIVLRSTQSENSSLTVKLREQGESGIRAWLIVSGL